MPGDGARIHRVRRGYGHTARYYEETTEYEKEVIHRVIEEEIYSNRHWCLIFAQMSSKKCQKLADEKGWHKGEWKEDKTLKSKAELQREKNRRYREAHREELNAKARAYHAKKKEEERAYLAKSKQQSQEHQANAEERKRLKKERSKEYQKKWAAAHRDKVQAACKRYYAKHREEVIARALRRYYAQRQPEGHPDTGGAAGKRKED